MTRPRFGSNGEQEDGKRPELQGRGGGAGFPDAACATIWWVKFPSGRPSESRQSRVGNLRDGHRDRGTLLEQPGVDGLVGQSAVDRHRLQPGHFQPEVLDLAVFASERSLDENGGRSVARP